MKDLLIDLREQSFLFLGTRAEDDFAQLEKISSPILNIEKVPESLCIKHRSLERYQVAKVISGWSGDSSFPGDC